MYQVIVGQDLNGMWTLVPLDQIKGIHEFVTPKGRAASVFTYLDVRTVVLTISFEDVVKLLRKYDVDVLDWRDLIEPDEENPNP